MSINVGTLITSSVRPNDSLDPIASALANEIQGGAHSESTLAGRNAIIAARRDWGMLCNVYNDGGNNGTYQLVYNHSSTTLTDNANWVPFTSGSSISGLTVGQFTYADSATSIKNKVDLMYTDGTNIGIGASTPAAKLDVTGSIKGTSTLRIDGISSLNDTVEIKSPHSVSLDVEGNSEFAGVVTVGDTTAYATKWLTIQQNDNTNMQIDSLSHNPSGPNPLGSPLGINTQTGNPGKVTIGGYAQINGGLLVQQGLDTTGCNVSGALDVNLGAGWAGAAIVATSTAVDQLKLIYDTTNFTNIATTSLGDLMLKPSHGRVAIGVSGYNPTAQLQTSADATIGTNLAVLGDASVSGQMQVAGDIHSIPYTDITSLCTCSDYCSSPPSGFTIKVKKIGKTIFLHFYIHGTNSNSNTLSMTIPADYKNNERLESFTMFACNGFANGALDGPASCTVVNQTSSVLVTFYKITSDVYHSDTWSIYSKGVVGVIVYEGL